MFREMRRRRQQLSPEECKRILAEGTSGVLAVRGDEGYPYAVPLSYVYEEGRLFFHGAAAGHGRDAVLRDPKASFCVIGGDRVVPEEYTTYFRSVIVFGKIRILEEEAEKRSAIEKLAEKYSPPAGRWPPAGDRPGIFSPVHDGADRGAHDGQASGGTYARKAVRARGRGITAA